MPQYKTHVLGGLCSFAILRFVLHGYNPTFAASCEWLLFAILGSLFPDVDIKSKGQKIFYRFLMILFVYYAFVQKVYHLSVIGCLAIFPLLVRHRGIFHRIWFIVLLGVAMILWAYFTFSRYTFIVFWDAIFFTSGAISHIWLDVGIKRMIKNK